MTYETSGGNVDTSDRVIDITVTDSAGTTGNAASATIAVIPDTDGDGVIDTIDIDDDNDGILDLDEQTITFTPFADTAGYSYAQNNEGNLAEHYPDDLSVPDDDNPLNLIDGDLDTELRMHSYDVFEYDLGQVVPAGTSITFSEGLGGEDSGIMIYVSLEFHRPEWRHPCGLG